MIKAFTCILPAIAFFCLSVKGQTSAVNRVIVKKGESNLSTVQEHEPVSSKVRVMPAQGPGQDAPQKRNFTFPRRAVVDYGAITVDYAPTLLVRELPRQGPEKKMANASAERRQHTGRVATLPDMVLGESFSGNPFSVATPNDNDIAISDSGYILSVINTNIFIRNVVTNKSKPIRSLFSFTDPINDLADEFDPKVLYDPTVDRFVMMCMVGFVDTTSKMIVGFSQTNNPDSTWNLYELPGDALNNGLWSDYPMIAVTEKELFLSVNLLYNDSSWQTGFVETIVWQMSKDSGFAGKDLNSVLHSNIKHNGRAIRNLCPAKGGSKPHGPNMYFVSNRNLDQVNDTVFLVNITDVIGSPNSSVTVKALRTNLPYRFPPDGVQNGTTDRLATNDSRNLGAFFENDRIQFVHNTKHSGNNRPTVQHGVIHQPGSSAPIVTGYLVENDSLDFAYPNISYAGIYPGSNDAIITFNHSSPSVFPGCSAVQTDGFGEFSHVLKIKDGVKYVDLLQSDLERWGDYSGSQRRYNSPGEVWMSGYFGYGTGGFPNAHGAWISQITTEEHAFVAVREMNNKTAEASVYPNPAAEMFSVDIDLNEPEYLTIELLDSKGAHVVSLRRDWVKTTTNTFSFNTRDLARGVYFLKITGNKGTNKSTKVVVN